MNIKSLRKALGLTQVELALKLDVKRTTVCMWECGKSKPRYDMLVKISKALDCSVDDLFQVNEKKVV